MIILIMNKELSNINKFKLSLIDKSLDEKLEARAKIDGIIKYKKSKADKYEEETGCIIWLEWDVGGWLKDNVSAGSPILTRRKNCLPDGISEIQSHRWQMIHWIPENILIEYIETTLANGKKLTKKGVELFALKYKPVKEKEFEKPVIYHDDCVEFLKRFEDKSIDLLITDPSYSTDIKDLPVFLDSWLYDSLNKIKDTGRAFICIGAYPIEIYTYLGYLMKSDWIIDCPLIWTYRNTLGQTPNMKYNLNYQLILHLYRKTSKPLNKSITNEMFSVQDINAPDGRIGDRYYKWQKPDLLAKRLINHTTKKGDNIIDPFAGSGTFILKASELGRIASGCEIDEDIMNIAIQRGCAKE